MQTLPGAPPPDINEAVTRILGGGMNLIRAIEHSRPNVTSARRRYFTHTFEVDGREFAVFSKTSPAPSENLLATETFLASCRFKAFRTPTFFGMGEWTGGSVAVWEAVRGKIYPMEAAPPSIVNRLVRIAAEVAGATDQARAAIPTIDRRNTVFEQLSDMLLFTLRQLADLQEEMAALSEESESLKRDIKAAKTAKTPAQV